jgi:HAD superfamily hydrolase (TIGR01490 family)
LAVEAAFFDLDKTVISRSSSFALSRPMHRAGFVSRGQMLRAAYAQLVFQVLGADEKRMDRAKNALLELTRGWDRSEVEDLVREVVIEVIDPFVYQEALDLIAEHREAGRQIFIVSTAPEEVVYPIARHFGADGVVATRAEIVDGRYTGKLAFYCYGQAKSDAIRSMARRGRVDLAESYAYSDSVTDLPMLEAVGHPVVVNGSRELRKEAETRGWETLEFHRPVPLIPRPPVPPPKPTLALAAVATALGVAAWLFIRTRRGNGRRA